MTSPLRILAFAGSARRDSLNRKLLAVAVQATRDAGAEVTLLDLNEFPLPIYHGELEDAQGMPAQCNLPRAHEAFDEQGGLKDARTLKHVQAVARELLATTTRFAG